MDIKKQIKEINRRKRREKAKKPADKKVDLRRGQ